MRELTKIRNVLGKKIPGSPHECLLVLDATTGQNALSQARIFGQEIQITGIVLAKLDGTAKGGIVVAIHESLGIPIKLIGVGEQLEDLRPFEPEVFARAIFGGDGDDAPPAGR
jgi:fused signal recognition particle receptor